MCWISNYMYMHTRCQYTSFQNFCCSLSTAPLNRIEELDIRDSAVKLIDLVPIGKDKLVLPFNTWRLKTLKRLRLRKCLLLSLPPGLVIATVQLAITSNILKNQNGQNACRRFIIIHLQCFVVIYVIN